jgi:hypothetical protein
MSCLGRERIFDHFSRTLSIPVSIIRLYYATELRYGVLVDLAMKVNRGESVDVSMGHFNAIWQQEANAQSLATLALASSPPFVLNVVGREVLSTRQVVEQFGRLLGMAPHIHGSEADDAILGNSALAQLLFGEPRVDVEQMMRWITAWVQSGGANLKKPTHFEERAGKF